MVVPHRGASSREQETLNKKYKRFRQVKNDLQMMISQQENRLNLANSNNDEIDVLSSTNHIEEVTHLTYDNLPHDLTDFFYEEVNFDE